ncbi:EscS/YscS/HrcS family type III secretion system export apparatus protein [Deltaproteobacteria bacterium Smac51]|nr:EscS/YscS/HrcS family type III secretion system export apparatus protein [Deltaproteobacteria bacterium Smac51]
MEATVFSYAARAMYLVLMLSLPPIIVASVVGLGLSLFQAITQLQEQTLSFGVKLIAVVATIFITASWLGGELLRYGQDIFEKFYLI